MNSEVELVSKQDELRKRILSLFLESTDASLASEQILPDTEFTESGMSSIEYLKFVDTLESTFGITVDLESDGNLNTIDKFLAVLQKQGISV